MQHFKTLVGLGLAAALTPWAHGAALIFNSATPATSAATRTNWLTAAGNPSLNLITFESGFTDGQNIAGVTGLFPDGLVISNQNGANVLIDSGPGSISGGNPIGTFAAAIQTTGSTSRAILDFSANPVDAFGLYLIDFGGGSIQVFFADGSNQLFSPTIATGGSGDSAEFTGVFRNDQAKILRALITDTGGSGLWALDNIEYTVVASGGTTGGTSGGGTTGGGGEVPEPSTAILSILGLTGVLAYRKKS